MIRDKSCINMSNEYVESLKSVSIKIRNRNNYELSMNLV